LEVLPYHTLLTFRLVSQLNGQQVLDFSYSHLCSRNRVVDIILSPVQPDHNAPRICASKSHELWPKGQCHGGISRIRNRVYDVGRSRRVKRGSILRRPANADRRPDPSEVLPVRKTLICRRDVGKVRRKGKELKGDAQGRWVKWHVGVSSCAGLGRDCESDGGIDPLRDHCRTKRS
jgi:hypothetical protein